MKVTAVAQRSGNWWAIRIPEVDGAFTQTRRLDQVADMAAEAAALMLDVDPAGITVEVEAHTNMDSLLATVREARDAAEHAAEQSARITRKAARELLAEDYTVRDTGRLLGLSPQRVSQLAHEDDLMEA